MRLFFSLPSLLWFHQSFGLSVDTAMDLVLLSGAVLAAAAALGRAGSAASFAVLWLLYLSAVNVAPELLGAVW
jgi:hypothetical protein